jgi:hypothetical protein
VTGNSKFLGTTVLQTGTIVVNRDSALSEVSKLVVGGKDSVGAVLDVRNLSSGLVVGDNRDQTLKGKGHIRGGVAIEALGVLAPGTSIDTLTGGTITFSSGGVYEAEYLASGGSSTSDMLRASSSSGGSGQANLSGGYVLPKAVSRLTDFNAHTFSIMTASAGINGTFDGIVQTAAIRGTLTYSDASANDASLISGTFNALKMTLTRVPYQTLGGTGMAASLGAVLDQNLATTDSKLSAMIDGLDALPSVAQVRSVLLRVNPRAYAEVHSVAVSRLQDLQKSLAERLTSVGAAAVRSRSLLSSMEMDPPADQWTAWTSVYGTSGNRPGQSADAGGSSWSNFGNITAVERNFGLLTVGLLGSVGTGTDHINSPDSSIVSDSWHTGLYSSMPLNERAFLDAAFLCGQAENVVKRPLPYLADSTGARSTVLSQEWVLQMGMGLQMAPKQTDWSALLSAKFAYGSVHVGSVSESGVGALGMDAAGHSDPILLSRIGLEIVKESKVYGTPVRTAVSIAGTRDQKTDSKSVGVHLQGNPDLEWMVTSERYSPNSLNFGASIEIGVSDRRTLKIYGEQNIQPGSSGGVSRGGVSFTIGF